MVILHVMMDQMRIPPFALNGLAQKATGNVMMMSNAFMRLMCVILAMIALMDQMNLPHYVVRMGSVRQDYGGVQGNQHAGLVLTV